MNKPQFANDEIYHIYNRGVEKRNIFLEDRDYLRFIHNLFEFNDIEPASSSNVRFLMAQPSKIRASDIENQLLEVGPLKVSSKTVRQRKLLVEILVFCLMPNHYHLLVRQVKDGGIVKFMQKLGTGYSVYFNQKNERVGPLFQGRFKAVLIKDEDHFEFIPYYIHLNPLDIVAPEWRDGKVKNYKQAVAFLEQYRWSSLPDYVGKKNFPSVIQRTFLSELFGSPEKHQKSIRQWLSTTDFSQTQELLLE
jgi:putative transposase